MRISCTKEAAPCTAPRAGAGVRALAGDLPLVRRQSSGKGHAASPELDSLGSASDRQRHQAAQRPSLDRRPETAAAAGLGETGIAAGVQAGDGVSLLE